MSEATVTTQAELDEALKDGVSWVEIRSERGVWLEVFNSGSATVTASGSATVRAYDSATVRAYDSATVRAYGSATVTAYDSATVRAYGSATVTAYDSATVTASKYTAVHLHSARVNVKGGVIIDHTKVDLTDAAEWADYYGVEVADGIATVYKAVNDAYTTDRGTDYSPGTTPNAWDWKKTPHCGNGLHFGPTPHHALAYHPEATRFMEAKISVTDLVPINNGGTAKCKAPGVVGPLVEVDIHGNPVAAPPPAPLTTGTPE